jgi:26S proteasome regulatory subunit N13
MSLCKNIIHHISQDASSARDAEFVDNINGLLQDEDYTPVWNTHASGSSQNTGPGPSQTSS